MLNSLFNSIHKTVDQQTGMTNFMGLPSESKEFALQEPWYSAPISIYRLAGNFYLRTLHMTQHSLLTQKFNACTIRGVSFVIIAQH